MRNLTKLKYLRINLNCYEIPCGIIANLTNLEFLKIDVFKSEDSNGRFEIDELGCLKQLKYLEISIFSDSKDVEKFLSYPQLADCTRDLTIATCNDVTSLSLSTSSSSSSSDLCFGHLKELKYLFIERCSEMKELKLNKEAIGFGGLYESLERMILNNLPKLIISWEARNLHCAHFKKLNCVQLIACDAIVDLTWLQFLPNLQSLWIHGCDGLQEILSSCSDECGRAYDQNTFSNLKELKLQSLPNLWSICSMSALPFPSLETIDVIDCPKLRRLPLDSNSASNTLKKIQGEEEWWDRLEWENETIKPQFAKFYRLRKVFSIGSSLL